MLDRADPPTQRKIGTNDSPQRTQETDLLLWRSLRFARVEMGI